MIKKIIACADVHIRNLRRHEEYQAQLNKFVADCKKYAEEYGPELPSTQSANVSKNSKQSSTVPRPKVLTATANTVSKITDKYRYFD